MELSIAYAMYDMMNLPLAFGGKVNVIPHMEDETLTARALMHFRPNIVFTLPIYHFSLLSLSSQMTETNMLCSEA